LASDAIRTAPRPEDQLRLRRIQDALIERHAGVARLQRAAAPLVGGPDDGEAKGFVEGARPLDVGDEEAGFEPSEGHDRISFSAGGRVASM
jgi:hypothetical protein